MEKGQVDPNELVSEFMAKTGADSAMAHMCLMSSHWNLDHAINHFHKEYGYNDSEEEISVDNNGNELARSVDSEKSVELDTSVVNLLLKTSRKRHATDDAQFLPPIDPANFSLDLKILSWNIDGLDDKSRVSRAEAVIQSLLYANADVVFLQEVIFETVSLLEANLRDYKFVYGDGLNPLEDYFVAVLLKKSLVAYQTHSEVPFSGSRMGRKMLSVEAKFGDIDLLLITSHLESGKEKETADERVKQMVQCFTAMQAAPKHKTVIFGGDLNTRDKEIEPLLKSPVSRGVVDLWVATGSAKKTQFTWDCLLNDNLHFNTHLKPRNRFDRLYLRNSEAIKWRPADFRLIGTQKISSCLCFPSDHFGIVTQLAFP